MTAASFGRVSVVMMARAASAPPPADSSDAAAGRPIPNGARGSCTPMTPVDATSTSDAGQPTASPAMRAVSRAASKPGSPVAAFAFPEFTTTARAVP